MNLTTQAYLFISSIQIGALMGIAYDLIRFVRKIIKHPNWLIQIEDFLFFLFSSFFVFIIMYQKNYGEIRIFVFIGILIGAVLYFCLASKYLFMLLDFIFKPIRCIMKMMTNIYLQIKIIISKQ